MQYTIQTNGSICIVKAVVIPTVDGTRRDMLAKKMVQQIFQRGQVLPSIEMSDENSKLFRPLVYFTMDSDGNFIAKFEGNRSILTEPVIELVQKHAEHFLSQNLTELVKLRDMLEVLHDARELGFLFQNEPKS